MSYQAPRIQDFRISLDPESLLDENKTDANVWLSFPELPETLNVQKSATYTDEVIPGWSEPLVGWSSSAATTIDFSVKIIATGDNNFKKRRSHYRAYDPTGESSAGADILDFLQNFPLAVPMVGQSGYPYDNTQPLSDLSAVVADEVLAKAEWLLALTYPQYDSYGKPYPPPIVHLEYGRNFRRRGVIKSVSLTLQGPWHPETLLCQRVDAAVSFQEVNRAPLGYNQVRKGIYDPTTNLNQSLFSVHRPNQSSTDLARREET